MVQNVAFWGLGWNKSLQQTLPVLQIFWFKLLYVCMYVKLPKYYVYISQYMYSINFEHIHVAVGVYHVTITRSGWI